MSDHTKLTVEAQLTPAIRVRILPSVHHFELGMVARRLTNDLRNTHSGQNTDYGVLALLSQSSAIQLHGNHQ